jgi:hypothetical protein
MQTQRRRDEKTMDIFSALLIFVGVMVLGGTAMVAAHWAIGLPGGIASDFPTALVILATAVAVAYLVRHRGLQ